MVKYKVFMKQQLFHNVIHFITLYPRAKTSHDYIINIPRPAKEQYRGYRELL